MTGEERFAEVVAALIDQPGVTPPEPGRSFGSRGLKVNNRIFAMLVRDRLVVKLPKAQVASMIASGRGEPFDAGKGRAMREWLIVGSGEDWRRLAREALEFSSAPNG